MSSASKPGKVTVVKPKPKAPRPQSAQHASVATTKEVVVPKAPVVAAVAEHVKHKAHDKRVHRTEQRKVMVEEGSHTPAKPPAVVASVERFQAADEQRALAQAAAYVAETFDPGLGEVYHQGVPDGLGCLTYTVSFVARYPVSPIAQTTSGDRYIFVAMGPDLPAAGPNILVGTALTLGGAITWGSLGLTSAQYTSMAANAASGRYVSYQIVLENASAQQVSGGILRSGRYTVDAAGNGFPTGLSTILGNEDAYLREDLAKSRPGSSRDRFMAWQPCGAKGKSMLAFGGGGAAMSTETGLLLTAQLPRLATGVTPGDWELFNVVVYATVQWVPATSGAVFAGGTVASDNAPEQVQVVTDMITAQTGYTIGNQTVAGAGDMLQSGYDRASSLAAQLAEGLRVAEQVVGFGMGLWDAASPYLAAAGMFMKQPSPDVLAHHYAAVSKGQTSLLVVSTLARFRGDSRFDATSVDNYFRKAAREWSDHPWLDRALAGDVISPDHVAAAKMTYATARSKVAQQALDARLAPLLAMAPRAPMGCAPPPSRPSDDWAEVARH